MKLCPTCRSMGTMVKISRKEWSSIDLGIAVYYDKYFCPSSICKCLTIYAYCKICRMFMPYSYPDIMHHEIDNHSRLMNGPMIDFPFIIVGNIESITNMNYRVMRKLCSIYPQFPTIVATQKQICSFDSDDKVLEEIIANLPFGTYECRLCSREYDTFPTEKQVNRHFKYCFAIGCGVSVKDTH